MKKERDIETEELMQKKKKQIAHKYIYAPNQLTWTIKDFTDYILTNFIKRVRYSPAIVSCKLGKNS